MAVNGIVQNMDRNGAATTKNIKSTNSTNNLKSTNNLDNINNKEIYVIEKTNSTEELSEAEEMERFKKEFYAEIEKIPRDRTIANVAINISEEAFQNMKDDPEYREQMLSLIRRDLTGSVAPAPDCSLLITVGATAKDYRGDSWSVGYDSEFYARSQNSFYKKTSVRKDRQKKLMEEYMEKRVQVKKWQQDALKERMEKQELERNRLAKSWSNERWMAKALSAYEANSYQGG